ncbi:SRPBCC family protein [Krasilnikoviella flava]|uniref:SRPBCC family protein n=1 Tax=Krasilnikoviella flava TaxID=526729 RepID=UPI00111C2A32|nr:SRPBCC family protein [Krasilnikoviella flava]
MKSGTDKATGVVGKLTGSVGALARALGDRAVGAVADKAGSVTDRLTNYADGGGPMAAAAKKGGEALAEGKSPLKAGAASAMAAAKEKVTGLFGGGDGGSGGGHRFINIIESIDVGAPIDVVYDAWTDYDAWPDFMKKVESADLDQDEGTVSFEGKVFWSHRRWEATIVDQIATRRVVWESTGDKGTLSGAVTFHALADDLTRIVVVVEYRPRGFVEKVANVWRPVGRRLRLELKFFVHHVMTDVILHPDDVEGYRAEIQEEEIVRTHDEVVADEEGQGEEEGEEEEGEEEEGEEEEGEEEEGEEEEGEEEQQGEKEVEERPRTRRSRSR